MNLSRRDALKGLLASGAIIGGQGSAASADSQISSLRVSSSSLDNGLRMHVVANNSRYISAALVLKSSEIRAHDGLGHLLEHTSFVGAAGTFAASEIKEMHQDCFQETDAFTQPGMIQWRVSFLPKHLEQGLGVLAVTSLDQKFDVETVGSEARVVLQELYLNKYHTRFGHRRKFASALFGSDHPYGIDTTESEIAKAKTAPEKLAGELRSYAQTISLPANMDLFLVGDLEASAARMIVGKCFGHFPRAEGPMLAVPRAPVTRAYRAFTALSPELRRPLSEISLAWNTGVGVTDPDAKVVLALSEYLNAILFRQLREGHGDAYSPAAAYRPDECSGVFEIAIPSTKAPHRIERRVFEAIAELKANLDARELGRFRDRLELRRRRDSESSGALVERLVDRLVDGGSVYDLDLETVTRDDVLAAARRYLPSYRGAYVRLSRLGK